MQQLDIINSKIQAKEILSRNIAMWRFLGKKVVFTNGCFDILHRGHIDYLAKASDLGDIFIIGVNSDASIKLLGKGENRPIQDELSRAMVLASLHFVSAVIIFDEKTPFELIQHLRPDILVKGADYDIHETNPGSKNYIIGSDIVKAHGGEVRTIEFLEGFSTTLIEKRIKNSCPPEL